MSSINRKHKDRLFSFLFGNGAHKEWTLSLYNAVNDSEYKNAEDIEITTIDDIIYMGMKNDVSFIISDTLSVYEQQSTYNPNMPVRMLMYIGRLYDKYIHVNRKNVYSQKLVQLPVPKLVVFYNGKDNKEDTILNLSDSFDKTNIRSDIEVKVRMININYGNNRVIMEKCEPLTEYSWLVDRIRINCLTMKIDEAVDKTINDMPDEFIIKKYLVANKAEVKNMCITEYNEAETMQMLKEEFREDGLREGRKEGIKQGENAVFSLYAKLKNDGRNEEAESIMNPENADLRKRLYEEYNI